MIGDGFILLLTIQNNNFWNNLWTALSAAGTIGATMCALNLLPIKSHKMAGSYWLDLKKKDARIHIELKNNSKLFDGVFAPKKGVLVLIKNDSRYLTLNADRDDFIIYHGTFRSLNLRTPKNAEAMKFLLSHQEAELYVFTTTNHKIKLTKKG